MPDPWPQSLVLRRSVGVLEAVFDDGSRFELPAPLLRAMTPSAAERGHTGSAQGPLAKDFSGVRLRDVRPVGAYAVRLVFDDGHDTGIYSWELLHRIGREQPFLEAEHRRVTEAP